MDLLALNSIWLALFSVVMGGGVAAGVVLQTRSIVMDSRKGALSKQGWAFLLKYLALLSFGWALYQYSEHFWADAICFAFGFFACLVGYVVARKKSLR